MTQENIIVEEVDPAKREPYVAGPNAIDISPDGDGGILKEIIKQGVGEYTPTPGCKVFVHYEGSLLDGTIFDSSKQRDSPFEFNLGKGQVIKAWDIGVATMKKGEIAMFTCKSEYAYGKTGSPPKIPPDTTLVFEVEMLDWQAEDLSSKKDGGILRHVIKAGEGHSTPNDGSTVDIHLVCEYNEKVVEERDVTFSLGEGSEFGIPPGIERALEKFKLREKSKLELKPMYGWGKEGKPDLGIPPDASLVYTITLNNFERLKDSWALDSDGKLEQGKFFKEKGTSYFKLGKFQLALKMYKKMVDYLEYDSGFEEEGEKERKSLLTVAHLNAALCHLKLEQHYEARERCDKALELDPKSDKGLFRRGQAYLGLGEPEKALNDFQAILNIDPNNKAASNHIIICGQKLKEQKIREKKIYANMFDKFAARDREEKDWRFGWWDGQNVEVQKMVIEKDVEEEDSRTKRINEKKEFIRKMQERKQRLEEELKAKSITVADEEDSNKDDQEDKENADEQKNKENIDQKNTDAITEMKKEEEEKRKQPDVMKTLGEWGKDEREREPTDFEKENPNILMLEGSGDFKNM